VWALTYFFLIFSWFFRNFDGKFLIGRDGAVHRVDNSNLEETVVALLQQQVEGNSDGTDSIASDL
jgi:hypothetical protein